jgi:hypothetical protein
MISRRGERCRSGLTVGDVSGDCRSFDDQVLSVRRRSEAAAAPKFSP